MYRRRYRWRERRKAAARAHHWALAAAFVLLATSSLAACGSNDTPADRPDPTVGPHPTTTTPTTPTTTTPATTTTPTTAALSPEDQTKAEVEAAFLAAREVITAQFEDPMAATDPEAHFIGDAHNWLQEATLDLRERGVAVRYPLGHLVPEIRDVVLEAPDQAQLTYCIVDTAEQVHLATSEVVDDEVSSQLSVADLQLIDGQWRVGSLGALNRWPDDRGCR